MSPSASTSVLFLGESWVTHVIHQKGFDTFNTVDYTEGATRHIAGLRNAGYEVTYLPAHEIGSRFPQTPAELAHFDVVVISDVGSNTFLLGTDTFVHSKTVPNRLEMIADYVAAGGALLMIGGWMSFTGIDAKARYGQSPLADVLPVTMLDYDDRVERPEGVSPVVVDGRHPALADVAGEWPALLGYNRLEARADATVLATVGDDPLLVVGRHGEGATAAFASDLAPHWAPPQFVDWSSYDALWSGLLTWLAQPTESVVPAA
jgi:uncharacterized membrane protein